ncbi:MAG: serine/threonine-protein kinase [Planctomycetota bacterium]
MKLTCPFCDFAFEVSLQPNQTEIACLSCADSFNIAAAMTPEDWEQFISQLSQKITKTKIRTSSPKKTKNPKSHETLEEFHPHLLAKTPAIEEDFTISRFEPSKRFRLGEFEILEELGGGGMGIVYLATQKSLNRYVALKVLNYHVAMTPEVITQFHREAQLVANLKHENILSIYGAGEANDVHYYAMEYVKGVSLERWMKENPISYSEAALFIYQAALGLEYAHRHGIIHRDIKPGNLLLGEGKSIKISDFGLAKVISENTHSGRIKGTIIYMSPEQIIGKSIDVRSDIYSLGATFYHLLTKQPPYLPDRQIWESLEEIKSHPPIPIQKLCPDLPPALKKIIATSMARKPTERYPSMKAFSEDLARYLLSQTGRLGDSLLLLSEGNRFFEYAPSHSPDSVIFGTSYKALFLFTLFLWLFTLITLIVVVFTPI